MPHEKTIREEHGALAGKIIRVCQALGETPQDRSEVILTLQEFLKKARAVFRHEVRLMKISEFSGRYEHMREHVYLIKGLEDCIGSFGDVPGPLPPEIGDYLRIWLPYHQKKYDVPFFEFLKGLTPAKAGIAPRTGSGATAKQILRRRSQGMWWTA